MGLCGSMEKFSFEEAMVHKASLKYYLLDQSRESGRPLSPRSRPTVKPEDEPLLKDHPYTIKLQCLPLSVGGNNMCCLHIFHKLQCDLLILKVVVPIIITSQPFNFVKEKEALEEEAWEERNPGTPSFIVLNFQNMEEETTRLKQMAKRCKNKEEERNKKDAKRLLADSMKKDARLPKQEVKVSAISPEQEVKAPSITPSKVLNGETIILFSKFIKEVLGMTTSEGGAAEASRNFFLMPLRVVSLSLCFDALKRVVDQIEGGGGGGNGQEKRSSSNRLGETSIGGVTDGSIFR
eukprot:Gb_30754 [translate_table: standard]